MTKLVAIVDSNEVQSDGFVHDTLPLGELRGRARGAGWRYWEVDGNSCKALRRLLDILATEPGPHFVVAKTKKGAGVSFMAPSDSNTNFYSFHSGKLPENLYTEAIDELLRRIDLKLNPNDEIEGLSQTVIDHSKPKFRTANFVDQWRDLLLDLGSELGNVVVLDADLKLDTGTYGFARAFPERYLQMGIAEQDMVSVAGALAVAGYRPYVHSFASFLMRATEQISNNSTERTPVVYVGALAGVLPAAPGHSHQSLSDVGIMGSMPNMEIFEPACPTELAAVSKVIALSERPCYLRLANWEPLAEFSGETIERGSGVLRVGDGRKIFICSSAPLAQQAMMAVSTLAAEGMAWSVMTYPWLTEAISDETAQMLRKAKHVILIENHYPAMALSRRLEDAGVRGVKRLGPVGIPPCGMPEEVLQELGLSATTLAQIARELDA